MTNHNRANKLFLTMLLIVSFTRPAIAQAPVPRAPEIAQGGLDKTYKVLQIAIATTFLLPLISTVVAGILKKARLFGVPTARVGVATLKGSITESAGYTALLREYFEDPAIKAIVLKIESGGGASGASQAIFNEILELKKAHPKFVVAITENIAASGAYYVASAADHIICTPSAIIGSIGCYNEVWSYKELLDVMKIKHEYIKTGEFKTAGSPYSDITDAQRAHLQEISKTVYKQFVTDIAAQRAKASISNDSDLWAQGKVFTGEQAQDLGLIDTLGTVSTLMQVLKEKANITDKIEWVNPQNNLSLLQVLVGKPNTQSIVQNIVHCFGQAIKNEITYSPALN